MRAGLSRRWRRHPRVRRRLSRRALAGSGAVLLLALPGCGDAPPAPKPDLILIVIDTLRADHVGAYGYERPTSPNIDRLAAGGVLFENAWAPSSWTKPSMGSLFTSRLPSEHGAVSFVRHLAPDLPTLAERLRDAGYFTLGVSGNFVHVNQKTGFARGFDAWKTLSVALRDGGEDSILALPGAGERPVLLRAPHAAEVNRAALDLLPEAGPAPLFLFAHYMEPHAGYAPADPWRTTFATDPAAHAKGREATSQYLVELASARASAEPGERQRLIDLYDAEIASVDHAVGLLIEALARRGFGENAVITVVSDHGEEFQEHGGWFHGLNLHRESLAVPIVLHDSRRPTSGIRRRDPVDLLDVPATLLDLAGVRPDPEMRGRALLARGPLEPRDLVAELHGDPPFERHVQPRVQRLALTRWPWKAIVDRDGARRVYQLDRDPGEADPRRPEATPAAADLVIANPLVARLLALEPAPGAAPLEPETLEGLRALGYAK